MTGLELTAKIYAKEIENGTKIKAIKENGDSVNLEFRAGKLNWETGTFNTGFLFDKNVKFEIVEEEKPKGWFKPLHGERYYYINDIVELNYCLWLDDEVDVYNYNNHNCFRSEEEAWEYKEYKEALRKAEKPFVRNEQNWHISHYIGEEKPSLDWNGNVKKQGVTYLGTDREVAQAFIDEWKDCILKYEFDILE